MQKNTAYGSLLILDQEAIFKKLVDVIEELAKKNQNPTIALTGGSTPKAFYQWVVSHDHFSKTVKEKVIWMTSDERDVPLDDKESNFGNADRLMLTPLRIKAENKKTLELGASYSRKSNTRSMPFRAGRGLPHRISLSSKPFIKSCW